jgi:DNA-binding GntR family transcriptional regulator
MAALQRSPELLVRHIAPVKRIELSEQVYQNVRALIVDGHLPPGSRVDLGALAESLEVSRSTVAQVAKRLAAENLLHIVPQTGTFVQRFTRQDVMDLYDVRLCLELWAAERGIPSASSQDIARLRELLDEFAPLFESDAPKDLQSLGRKNREFHSYLVSLANNRRLLEMYESLNVDVLGIREREVRSAACRARDLHATHGAIVRAYEQRDVSAAREAITQHLLDARDRLCQAYDASQ